MMTMMMISNVENPHFVLKWSCISILTHKHTHILHILYVVGPYCVYLYLQGRRDDKGPQRAKMCVTGKTMPATVATTDTVKNIPGRTNRNSPKKVPQIQAGEEITRSEIRTRYRLRGEDRTGEKRSVCCCLFWNTFLKHGATWQQNKQTKAEWNEEKSRETLMFMRLQLGPLKASLTCLTFQ